MRLTGSVDWVRHDISLCLRTLFSGSHASETGHVMKIVRPVFSCRIVAILAT